MDPKVDVVLSKAKKWKEEMQKLRMIILDCQIDFTEELKWGKPSYSIQKKNIVLIQAFKEYCALLFFKGALLQDPEGILSKIGESQAGRQIRFISLQQIIDRKEIVKEYIKEAVEVEKKGLKVTLKETSDYPIPDEFQDKLDENPVLKKAFEALTPGRQRSYIYYFSSAKQSKTREARVEKYLDKILDGKGLDD